jgi:hypothetical protein
MRHRAIRLSAQAALTLKIPLAWTFIVPLLHLSPIATARAAVYMGPEKRLLIYLYELTNLNSSLNGCLFSMLLLYHCP